MKSKLRPRCFFDIDIGHSPAGRIIFELYDDLCPRTTENFIKLCTGECGLGESTGKKLHYMNSTFHRVIKGFMIQGGDFSNGDGTGGESIYGGRFTDENLETPHDKPFLLSMANCGPNTNGSQFFITTKSTPHLDGKHVVFGHVVSGENLIESIENLPVNPNNKPVVDATISNCGELIPVRKKKAKKEKEASVNSSNSKGKKKKKSKKKKHRNKRKTKLVKEEETEDIYPKCSVRPDEIPEVPKPYFLYRGNLKEDQEKTESKNLPDKRKENEVIESTKYAAKEMIGRSGRLIKGRGQLRYYSKSPRDRMETPPHWRKETQNIESSGSNNNKKIEDINDRSKHGKSRSPSPNNKDYQRHRRSMRENVSPAPPNHRNKEHMNYELTNKDKRRKYEVWKDMPSEEKIKRARRCEELNDYGDIDLADKTAAKSYQKDNARRRSQSLDKMKRHNREKPAISSDHKVTKPHNIMPKSEPEKPEGIESETIIYPYADESDDSLKHKKSEKLAEFNRPIHESKSKILITSEANDKKIEPKKSGRNEHFESAKKTEPYPISSRKRSRSSEAKRKSVSPSPAVKKSTHSPPAHLVAKWQNRREQIRIRRSSRSIDRGNSKPRYSPRKRSSKYSNSPKSNNIKETKPQNEDHKVPEVIRKPADAAYREHSSSGTEDSSLSSAGSSVSNRPCRIDSELSDTEKTVNTQSWINDSSVKNNQPASVNREVKKEIIANIDKPKEINENNKDTEDIVAKKALMVLKGPEKPWLTNQWKAEEEEANKRNKQTNSVLAKLREDDQKVKTQEKPVKPSVKDDKKTPSPISMSISKYRSPSGTKSSGNPARSSYSSSSSSRSYSRKRSRSRDKSRSRSKNHSRSRYRSRSRSAYRKKYRSSRYHRNSRRSTSRSGKRYRSRSRSYSREPRRRYSSKSSSSSNSSRYGRSRRNYRGLSFRRPSSSPRPRR